MPGGDYDLFVLGAGSGGVRAGRVAAHHGARVAVAEQSYLGGTCVNVGCIPKKLLVYAAHFGEDFEDAAGFGWTVGERRADWSRLIAGKNDEIARLNGVYRKLLTESGVDLIEGRAALVDAHTVAVDNARYTARYILVATGSRPVKPEIAGIEHVITSDDVFFLDEAPRRILIVGGGYIAVEFAGIFRGLGAAVTLVHRGSVLLRGFDDDVQATLASEMGKRGIDLRFNREVAHIARQDGALRTTLDDGAVIEADQILCATGRLPNTLGLGLQEAGVESNEKGAIVVDEFSQSSVPNIYAVGDCTDRLNLTPVAIAEGQAVAETLFGAAPTKPDHEDVATAVFSRPSIGSVGLTEAEARERYDAVDVYKETFRPLKHALTGRDETTMMKLIVDRESDRVVGCHMVGPEAAEIIQGFAVAVKCRATKAQFDATIGIHPTAAEEFVNMRQKATK